MATKQEINRLYDATQDAYSRDRYRSWRAVCAFLLREGYTHQEAYCILCSKWMRWAADESKKPFRRVSANDLRAYLPTGEAGQREVQELVEAYERERDPGYLSQLP